MLLFKRTRVIFEGEPGIDSGGIAREWYLLFSQSWFDPAMALFRRCGGGGGGGDGDTAVYHIDPRSSVVHDGNVTAIYRTIGLVLGMAIAQRQLLQAPLSDALYKFLIDGEQQLSCADLRQTDGASYARSLEWMLSNDLDAGAGSSVCATFSLEQDLFGSKEVVDLKPGGRDIEVTEANKREYVDLVVAWKTRGCVSRQLDALVDGFRTHVDPGLVRGLVRGRCTI